MIDIHSHILPGVDDGASSMKESLHMLSMARRQGITDVFATSHYSKAFPNRDPEKLRRLRDELMSRANRPVQGPEGKVKCKRPIRIEISCIPRDLIIVIFYYQISLKPLKTLSLAQVSFPLLFPLCYIVPPVFTNSDKGKYKGKKTDNTL